MARRSRRRSSLRGLGAAFGTAEILTLVVAGGAVAYLLWPKKAKAQEFDLPPEPKEPVIPPVAGGGMPAPSTPTFKDPATGVVVAGPSTGITPPPPGATDLVKTVERNESWSNLASRSYGDFRWWPFLWDYNRSIATQYDKSPDYLNRGDSIRIPALPPMSDSGFQAAIFARADAHRQYWLDKKKGKTVSMPALVLERTPVPTESGGVSGLGYGCAGC